MNPTHETIDRFAPVPAAHRSRPSVRHRRGHLLGGLALLVLAAMSLVVTTGVQPASAASSVLHAYPQGLTAGQSVQSPGGAYRLVMQGDGNLVLYATATAGGHALWSSRTQAHPGASAWLQPDGNFVIYGTSGALWNTGTGGHPTSTYRNSVLVVQDDGNVVIYDPSGRPLWNTGTYGRH